MPAYLQEIEQWRHELFVISKQMLWREVMITSTKYLITYIWFWNVFFFLFECAYKSDVLWNVRKIQLSAGTVTAVRRRGDISLRLDNWRSIAATPPSCLGPDDTAAIFRICIWGWTTLRLPKKKKKDIFGENLKIARFRERNDFSFFLFFWRYHVAENCFKISLDRHIVAYSFNMYWMT